MAARRLSFDFNFPWVLLGGKSNTTAGGTPALGAFQTPPPPHIHFTGGEAAAGIFQQLVPHLARYPNLFQEKSFTLNDHSFVSIERISETFPKKIK